MKKFSPMRSFLALAGSLVTLTAILALLFTWIAYRSAALGTAPGVALHPQRIETPFTLARGIKPSEFAAMVKLPIYPESVADESTLSRWLPVPRPKSGKGVGLALLRLRAGVRPAQAEDWYKDQLGPDFVRTEGNLPASVEGTGDWLRRLSRTPNANAVLFVRSQPGTVDGVLLEPNHASERVLITIFRYGGPRSRENSNSDD
jgi:hypothetical protein